MIRYINPRIAKFLCQLPSHGMHVETSQMVFRRTVFTRDFLGLSLFSSKQKVVLQDLSDKNVDIKKLRQDIQNLFISQSQLVDTDEKYVQYQVLSEDVKKMIYTSKTPVEIQETKDFLKKYILQCDLNNPILHRKCAFLWRNFIALCHESNTLKPAEDLWLDAEFKAYMGYIDEEKKTMGVLMPSIAEVYLDLLYRHKRYKDVIREVEYIKENVLDVPIFLMSAAMMSCLKMNTKESSAIAMNLMKGDNVEQLMRFPYVAHPYALLACLQNNYGLAFEALSFISKQSMLRAGLLVHVLCKMGRVSAAIEVLEGVVRQHDLEDEPAAPPKLYFPMETVTSLTDAVEITKDNSFKVRLASLFKRLDKIATIDQRSLYDAVTADIEETRIQRNSRQKNLNRLSRKRLDISKDDEDNLENQKLLKF